MTDQTPETPDTPETGPASNGERIAKVMARAGVASRREAERMIVEGRVAVNGTVINSPALDILPTDRVTVDGKKLDEPQETRLWMYYKPVGLVTSESDEKGRQTVFDALPRDLPRVMSVGRLDLNSEGLLLLTNDGELKRRLELPATGWLRRYRVRVNGQPSELTFDPLRRGATIDGEDFAPMEIRLDSQQGANAWLTVGIREGRNREIRRAMAHVGLIVNRLIRIAYGPFRLTGMEPNEVREIKRRVLRDQLGGLLTGEEDEAPAARRFGDKPRFGDRPPREDGDRKPRFGDRPRREDGDAPRKPRAFGDRPPREDGDRKPRFGDRPRREDGDAPRKSRSFGDRKPRFGDRPRREDGDAPRKPRSFGTGPRRDGDGARDFGDRPRKPRPLDSDRKPRAYGDDRPRREDDDRPRKPRDFAGPRNSEGDTPRKPRWSKNGPRREDGEGPRKPRAFGSGPRREDGDGPRKPRFGGPKGAGPKPGGPKGRPRGEGKPPRAPRG
ncbi:MAG: pseudouridine synthase [Paracoccus sp. (in: a-proteobacteria)]|uniref:pseudouridine synthase n=1 Tax=Paracoccus sp. TaxID=267 RepID=UPI0026E0A252|nr:pseudouridine synthase [Paracoccus sp. (in: a-proteobacteria)]MDO5612370.1 pseudouridine synthase [Paracoccus sp. (in: a-proteobacteria)]